jgi:hypothetical protein
LRLITSSAIAPCFLHMFKAKAIRCYLF